MKHIFIVAVCCACIGNGRLFAQDIDRNEYADGNKELFSLPRSDAMAGSDIGVNGGAAPLSNPAALIAVPTKEVSLFYAGYFQNSFSTSSISYTGPIDSVSSIGVSLSYVLMTGIELHPESDGAQYVPDPVPTATSSDCYFRVAYGRTLYHLGKDIELSAGAAVSGKRQNLIGWTGYGIGVDAGADLFLKNSGLVLGVMIDNVTMITHWSAEYKEYAPLHVRAGLGWQREFPYIYGRLSAAYLSPDLLSNEGINHYGKDSLNNQTNVELPEFKRVSKHPLMLILGARGGLEYTIMDKVSFRAGLRSGIFAFGGGLRFLQNRAGLDFAYLSHSLAPTYKLSVDFRWM